MALVPHESHKKCNNAQQRHDRLLETPRSSEERNTSHGRRRPRMRADGVTVRITGSGRIQFESPASVA
uniref:Uncharacterized protein n=1 Tax=Thermocrispum agreste TaxID=37925 RepID=A0A2W4LFR0_9PSEU|nr:MAG: hypothetical protein DIU77_04665 [Thermocrispum agreste]